MMTRIAHSLSLSGFRNESPGFWGLGLEVQGQRIECKATRGFTGLLFNCPCGVGMRKVLKLME